MEVKVTKISKGSIFTVEDHNPTGDIAAHNYIIINICDDNIPCSKVMCMGITSCRNASPTNCFHDMMPIVMSNGYRCFVDTTKVYFFRPQEVNLNRFKGSIDLPIVEKLLKVFLIRIGLGVSKEYSSLKEELGLRDISTPQKNMSLSLSFETSEVREVTETVTSLSNKEVIEDSTEEESKNTKEEKTEKSPWYPRLIAEYTDEQLERALVILKSGDAEWCAREMHCNNHSAIRQKMRRISEEIDLRTPQKFSEKFQKFGTKPEFWEKTDLERFSKLFTSDREKLEIETGQKSAQLFKIFDTVKKELKRREIG
jgi:hypothetical protein